LLNLAAALDRVARDPQFDARDKRWASIRSAIECLSAADPGRAERIQHVFSLPYQEDWRKVMEL
jgi:hypothetical protein